ncbi:MAG TPA: ABC transporter ATP-binding protein [Candidatus Limnocylindria bacterium]|nr:ABC transporter ATP-binding protein [Candidatus Limnocylindria bacterium]
MARPMRQLEDEVLERPFNKNQFFRLLAYLRPYRREVYLSVAAMAAAAVAGLGAPYLMSRAVGVLAEGRTDGVWPAALGMAALAALGAWLTRLRVRWMDTAGRKALAALREDLFRHVQSLSFSFFDTHSSGKILVRVINDVDALNDLFTNGIINVLIDALTVVLLIALMLLVNWQLTLIGLCILPALTLVIFGVKRQMRVKWQIVRAKRSNMNGYLHEALTGMRVTQAFVREDENSAIFRGANRDIRRSWMEAIRYNAAFWPLLDLTGTAGTALVYFFGVRFMGTGLRLPDLLLVLWYLHRFWMPLNTLSNFYNSLLTASASMERIFEVMDEPPRVKDREGAYPLPEIRGHVRFEGVTFAYNAEKVVLRDVSLDVPPGSTVALVGETGAGKTTIVNLISRFYDVTGGRVTIDGHDLRDVTLDSLRGQMSVMQQESFTFSGTILDNIRYGRLDADDDEVIAAAKAVGADAFVARLPKGWQTEVSERGASLSTGEKQLVSFARALLNDPRILILDEATSSVDTRTEMQIQKALETLLRGRTSFVIAHRLSTIRKADLILVVEGGEIAERGTHEELIRLPGGRYRALCEAQARFMKE